MQTARIGDDDLVGVTSGSQSCPFCHRYLEVDVDEDNLSVRTSTLPYEGYFKRGKDRSLITISEMMDPFSLPCCGRMAWFQDDGSPVLLPKDDEFILTVLQKVDLGHPKLNKKWSIYEGFNTITKKKDLFACFNDSCDFNLNLLYRFSGKLKMWQFHSYSSSNVLDELNRCGRFKNIKLTNPVKPNKLLMLIWNLTLGKFLKIEKEMFKFLY